MEQRPVKKPPPPYEEQTPFKLRLKYAAILIVLALAIVALGYWLFNRPLSFWMV